MILTLELNEELARELTAWRERFFPPERNFLSAHVTLFHALPSAKIDDISARLRELTGQTEPFEVLVRKPYSLGRGVALEVEAPAISGLRKELRESWLPDLGPQDRVEKIRPHVTIQNKVSVEESRKTFAEVEATWPRETRGRALGLGLWEYRGGPWDHLAWFRFRSGASRS